MPLKTAIHYARALQVASEAILVVNDLESDIEEFKAFEDIGQKVDSALSDLDQLDRKRDGMLYDLEQRVEVARELAMKLEKPIVRADIVELARKVEDAEQRCSEIANDIRSTRALIHQYETQREQLKMNNEECKKGIANVETLREAHYFYKAASCVQWNTEAPRNEVSGYISEPTNIVNFVLNSDERSQFYITNYLWDQMSISPDWD